MPTCERVIHLTNNMGKDGTVQCGRTAYVCDLYNKRHLCIRCFNKWCKKLDKSHISTKEHLDKPS
jgi:hypothetical protein